MSVRITDTDRGAKALVARIYDLARRNPVITMGIHDAEGNAVHDAKSGATILDVATFNEFGTTRIPERSFLRAWFDGAEAGLRRDLVVLTQSVVAGKRTADQVLELLGLRSVGQIQARISQGIPPPNAESTIKKKGSSTPLIDTGVLRSSVTYQVKDKP